MKEFCKKEIDFQVIKLNNRVDKMIEAMKSVHQEVEVTDMSGAREEMRAMRRDVDFDEEGEHWMGGGGGGGCAEEEVEAYMEEKLKCAAVKGIKGKLAAKKMKC